MEFRIEVDRMRAGDLINIDSEDHVTAISALISIVATMVWDGEIYRDREEVIKELLDLSMPELIEQTDKFNKSVTEYALLQNLFKGRK